MRGRILLVHLLSLVAGGLVLLRVNRHQWFFGDEWEFLGGVRRTMPWYDQLLQPHNEHWSTAPYVIYRLLEAAFGIRSYWPYIGLAILLHLVVVHLVWRVMLQARITPWVATVVVLPLLVLGAGSQNLLWAFQIGFLGSVALGLGTMLLVNHAGTWQRRDWAGTRAGRVRAALVRSVGAPRRRLRTRRPAAAGDQAGGRIRDCCRVSSTSSGRSPTRLRRTSPRRRCARSPTSCGRTSRRA